GEGLNRQGQIDRTHALLKTQAPENLRLIWSSLEDIQAQSSRIETIFNALYPKSQYDMQAPRVLAFLAEGTLRVNRPDLAEQALTSLRAMSKYENDDNMQPIPAGSFEMGADPEVILAECQKYYDSCEIGNYQDEAPMHTVTLNTFEMGVYEVTNAEYQQCVLSGVCVPPNEVNLQVLDNYFDENNANYPVINVNWYDASIYCVWRGMRLPSEAEWEYAARGGRESQLYPWGNALDNYLANFCDKNCAFSWAFTGIDDGFSTIAQVGSYQPNAFNLFDMSGNVSEWVSDYYEDQYYQSLPPEIQNPIGPLVGETRVLRGGSWLNTAEFLMVSIRTDFKPDNYFDNVGFRCAKSRD
ncbi:MAG: formylglycine-generating enzyme family protein, partial [Anaerolineae bacterium]|nr:formylglycine-generating enzyme family protein [Anaerolineae bacterium]